MTNLTWVLFLVAVQCFICEGSWIFPVNQQSLIPALSSVRKSLKKHEIIPDVIDDFEPTLFIAITYAKTKKTVNLGNVLNAEDLQDAPTVLLIPVQEASEEAQSGISESYTIVLTDPDALSRDDPSMSEMCHWIATDLKTAPFPDEEESSVLRSRAAYRELISYKPPSPPPKKGTHRYVFIVFKFNGSGSQNLTVPSERPHWGTGKVRHGARQWAKQNDLVPVGANFFFSANPEQ